VASSWKLSCLSSVFSIRDAASPRCVSGRRLCGVHNSTITGSHDRAAIGTVANQQPDDVRKQQRRI
jgi:hypothetical protein